MISGEVLFQNVAVLFATAFHYLTTTVLFTFAGKNVTLWSVCISLVAMSVFNDFLTITGVWDYGGWDPEWSDFDSDESYENKDDLDWDRDD